MPRAFSLQTMRAKRGAASPWQGAVTCSPPEGRGAGQKPEARAGFAPSAPSLLPVSFSQAAQASLAARADGASLHTLIEQVLGQDPRPAYQREGQSERIFGVRLRDVDVKFQAVKETPLENDATTLKVVAIDTLTNETR